MSQPWHIEETVDVGASPERVWDLLSDPRRDREWCVRVVSCQLLDAATPHEGARFLARHRPVPGPVQGQLVTIAEAVPPRLLRLSTASALGTLDVEYELRSSASKTAAVQRDRFALRPVLRPLLPWFIATKRRRNIEQLAALRQLFGG